MTFAEFNAILPSPGGRIRVRITCDALHLLWGDGVGPQTAAELFEQNQTMLATIAAKKAAAEDVDDGIVVISEADLDG